MAKGHVSKAYPYDGGVTEKIIKAAIERWCSEEGINFADAGKFIKEVEVKPGEYPQSLMGITIVQNNGAVKNTVHIKAF